MNFNIKTQLSDNISKYLLLLIGTFVLLPFNIKGLLVILFFILSIFYVCKNKNTKPAHKLLINTLLFVLYVISLLFTQNLKAGLGFLETTLSLLVIPMGFWLISRNREVSSQLIKNKNVFLNSFFYSCTVLSILIFWKSLSYFDWNNSKILINPFLTFLESDFYWMADHPIYLSLSLSLSLLITPELLKYIKKKYKILILFCFLIQLVALIILSRKGILIAFISVFVFRIFLIKKFSFKTILYIISFLGLITFIIIQFSSDTIKRFDEVIDPKSYEKVEGFSSTSIRYYIYTCSLSVSKKSLLFGYGIGDVKYELKKCYKKISDVLYNGNYNTHNQYLGILLYVGIFGLLFFLLSIGFNFKLFLFSKDYFSFSILLMFVLTMLFENIIDRQNGVILFSFFINYFSFINLLKSN